MCEGIRVRQAVVIPTSLKDKPYIHQVGDCRSYNLLIGSRCFDLVYLDEQGNKSVDCCVDDEGRLNGSPINEYWERAYKAGLALFPIYGRCVITMSDIETGDDIETDLNVVKEALLKFGFTEDELSFLK